MAERIKDPNDGVTMRCLIIGMALVAMSAACADPTGPEGEGVRASLEASGMRISNQTEAAIYYFAVERTAAAAINWAPCTDPETCPGVGPGGLRDVPYSEIGFWEPTSEEAILYWWHLVPRPEGGFDPDSIRALVTGL